MPVLMGMHVKEPVVVDGGFIFVMYVRVFVNLFRLKNFIKSPNSNSNEYKPHQLLAVIGYFIYGNQGFKKSEQNLNTQHAHKMANSPKKSNFPCFLL